MTIILAADNDWAIGKDGGLLADIPEDKKLFRETTKDSTVIMGRKTWDSLPKKPLPNRTNIVLSRTVKQLEGAQVFADVDSLLEYTAKAEGKVFGIGGAEIYRAFLPYCDTAHITWIDYEYMADTWFPDLDKDPDWDVTADSDEQTYFDLCYEFRRYERAG